MNFDTFYCLDVDHKNEVVTLSFSQERFTAHNLHELRVMADITGRLSQSLNKLLQSGLQDNTHEADYEAIDLTEITSQVSTLDGKHKREK